MKKLLLILILILISTNSRAKPPYHGTIWIAPNIITSEDPTAFKSFVKAGQEERTMFDNRVRKWVKLKPYLFTASFDDDTTIEVQVNPEFDEKTAFSEANKYLKVIGQLPTSLRKDVETVWIHKGNSNFGGGNKNLLIHIERGKEYIAKGILAETFIHEATHTSLDSYHATNKKWIAAQKKDPEFISTYAKKHPTREDMAESFLLYFAIRYKPDKIDKKMKKLIEKTMPNRIKYFDSLNLELHPLRITP